MTDLSLQKRLAAEVLGVGLSRIRIDYERVDEVESALRREDVRRLIKDGIIWAEPLRRNSRGRWKLLHAKRRKGHRRGPGKRKGAKGARQNEEELWVYTIRKIRRYLRWLRDHDVIDKKTYRRLYLLAKGGTFRSLSDLKRHLTDMGIQVR